MVAIGALRFLRSELWRYVGTPPYGRLRWPRDRRGVLGPLRWLLTPSWIVKLMGAGDPRSPYDGSCVGCEAY